MASGGGTSMAEELHSMCFSLAGEPMGTREEMTKVRDQLKAKADVMVQLGTVAINSGEVASTSMLMHIVDALVESGKNNCLVITILLGTQATCIEDGFLHSFLRQCRRLFSTSPNREHFKVANREVAEIVSKLSDFCTSFPSVAMSTILTFENALRLTDPSNFSYVSAACLTPAHTAFLQACVLAQNYTYAVKMLRSTQILEVDVANTGLTTNDYCKFFCLAGTCYLAVKDYAAALECFLTVITIPAESMSAIMVSALKKAKLVALIETGLPLEVPKYTSSIMSRYIRGEDSGGGSSNSSSNKSAYDLIVTHFVNQDAAAMHQVIEARKEFLDLNNDYGLAGQVEDAANKHRIRKLTTTYITLSLTDIASTVGMQGGAAEAEASLLRLIKMNEIRASIDQRSGMVRFEDSAGGAGAGGGEEDDLRELEELEGFMKKTTELSTALRTLKKQIVTTTAYVKSTQGAKVAGSGGPGGIGWQDEADFAMDTYA